MGIIAGIKYISDEDRLFITLSQAPIFQQNIYIYMQDQFC